MKKHNGEANKKITAQELEKIKAEFKDIEGKLKFKGTVFDLLQEIRNHKS